MNTMLPTWYRVLKHHYENDLYYNGLTIPYLLGASSIVEPNKPISTIYDFILEAQFHKFPYKILMLRCETDEEYVCRIFDEESKVDIYEPNSDYKAFDNLIVFDEFICHMNIEKITNKLYKLYNHYLQKELYSVSNGKGTPFKNYEIQRISKLKG